MSPGNIAYAEIYLDTSMYIVYAHSSIYTYNNHNHSCTLGDNQLQTTAHRARNWCSCRFSSHWHCNNATMLTHRNNHSPVAARRAVRRARCMAAMFGWGGKRVVLQSHRHWLECTPNNACWLLWRSSRAMHCSASLEGSETALLPPCHYPSWQSTPAAAATAAHSIVVRTFSWTLIVSCPGRLLLCLQVTRATERNPLSSSPLLSRSTRRLSERHRLTPECHPHQSRPAPNCSSAIVTGVVAAALSTVKPPPSHRHTTSAPLQQHWSLVLENTPNASINFHHPLVMDTFHQAINQFPNLAPVLSASLIACWPVGYWIVHYWFDLFDLFVVCLIIIITFILSILSINHHPSLQTIATFVDHHHLHHDVCILSTFLIFYSLAQLVTTFVRMSPESYDIIFAWIVLLSNVNY